MNNEQYIINVNVIARDCILKDRAIILENDRFIRILPMDQLTKDFSSFDKGRVYDGKGSLVAAGFIDIHSDNIESVIQPRPTSIMNFEMALMESEKQLVNQGITTMYHSLSFLRKEGAAMRDKEVRKPDKMRMLAEMIRTLHERSHIIRHRFHCRFDIRNSEGYDTLMDYLDKDYINLLSFIDHTPGQGQYRDLIKYRENLRNYKPDLEDNQIDSIIEERMAVPRISSDKIERTAEVARGKGIPIASHDDDSEEKIEYVHSELRADISEFPVELSVARKAREKGMLTVAGAPNVLMGRSHSGNLSAVEAILDGSIDILCSDYYPPAILHALFKLNNDYGMKLWDCINLVTLNPAKALGIDKEFGSVEEGKKADFLMIEILNGMPSITRVYINGELVSELNYRRKKYA
ncbi:MAG: alpha-D-ribose 1-methylphosphonate 5-triphosphate diphosphatase [Clostridiales bacterium GWC2_40_7]|nr:MAG: alpha-D-ribose 1-methylphosphonate 5-triphosphate diphosphatase [Clostridiales bacterium GWC2_40_7]